MWIPRHRGWLYLGVICMCACGQGYPSNGVPMNDFPLSSIDRNIDALGAEDSIRSDADAGLYVDALLEKFKLNENELPGLTEFRSTLVQAEFAAVLEPRRRVPEAVVGQVFNELMDKWAMPAWTRVSPQELHAFRVTMSLALYPKSVSRRPDGNLPPTCRPVEALYLIYLLHANMGVHPALREAVRTGRWPATDSKALPSQGLVRLGNSSKSPVEVQHLREYTAALSTYFSTHPDFKFQNQVEQIFDRLGITR